MIDTYGMNDINTQAIRELTTEVDALKRKVNKGGGSDLPEPTIADAGKVLGVNDQGKYALVEGGGGSNYIIGNATPYNIDITISDPNYDPETSWAKVEFSSPITNSLEFINNHMIYIRPAFKNSGDGGIKEDRRTEEWVGMIPDFIGTVNEAIDNDIFFSTDYLGWVDENNVIHNATGNEVIVADIDNECGYDISTGYRITNYAHAR